MAFSILAMKQNVFLNNYIDSSEDNDAEKKVIYSKILRSKENGILVIPNVVNLFCIFVLHIKIFRLHKQKNPLIFR